MILIFKIFYCKDKRKSIVKKKPAGWQNSLYNKYCQKHNKLSKSSSKYDKLSNKNNKGRFKKENLEIICKYCSNTFIEKCKYKIHHEKCKITWRKSCFYKALREIDF